MKDGDLDTYLKQHLSGEPPREAFKQQTLRDSTAALVRVRRRRSAWRRTGCAAAAVLIAGIAFLGGRLSVPRKLPRSMDVVPRAVAETDSVSVPSDLVAWLDAACLFRQLGMEDRMARALDRAGRLMPYDAVTANSVMGQAFTTTSGEVVEDQSKNVSLAGILCQNESIESSDGIMTQSFGGYYYASRMD